MAFATGCVVAAGALISSTTGRQVMTSAASNTAQHILAMVMGTYTSDSKGDVFLSTRIQAKLECILHLFKAMEVQQSNETNQEDTKTFDSYEQTMWNRVFREMTSISSLVSQMKQQQEKDAKSWFRYVWPRSQKQTQERVIAHLETIEEIIRFVSMVTPYIKQKN